MSGELSPIDTAKFVAAKRAVDFVEDGMRVGLGTGSTAAWMVRRLGERVQQEGLRIKAVPTSTRTAQLARELGIEVVSLDQAGWLDLTIDGADEFDGDLNLIKGGGGAHLQRCRRNPCSPRDWLGQCRSTGFPDRHLSPRKRRRLRDTASQRMLYLQGPTPHLQEPDRHEEKPQDRLALDLAFSAERSFPTLQRSSDVQDGQRFLTPGARPVGKPCAAATGLNPSKTGSPCRFVHL